MFPISICFLTAEEVILITITNGYAEFQTDSTLVDMRHFMSAGWCWAATGFFFYIL